MERGCGEVETVLRAAVGTICGNLVTRPTGCAVRGSIERQIEALRGPCLSVLDFTQVGVIDFSCADEVIAKLLMKYQRSDRPGEAFFVVQGASEHHRDLIETVLDRHNLLLVALEAGRPALWGPAPARLRGAWHSLDRVGRTLSAEFAAVRGVSETAARSCLKRLVARRVAVFEGGDRFASLMVALRAGAHYLTGAGGLAFAAESGGGGYAAGTAGAEMPAYPETQPDADSLAAH
jgi:hypothetical protein